MRRHAHLGASAGTEARIRTQTTPHVDRAQMASGHRPAPLWCTFVPRRLLGATTARSTPRLAGQLAPIGAFAPTIECRTGPPTRPIREPSERSETAPRRRR